MCVWREARKERSREERRKEGGTDGNGIWYQKWIIITSLERLLQVVATVNCSDLTEGETCGGREVYLSLFNDRQPKINCTPRSHSVQLHYVREVASQ